MTPRVSGLRRGEERMALEAALRAQGMKVESGGPESLPEASSGYSGRAAVVLDDLPALAITEGVLATFPKLSPRGMEP